MTAQEARKWLIYSSLIACGSTFVFLVLAPALGYPLEWHDALRIIELVTPVFLGYLGSGAHYVFGRSKQFRIPVEEQQGLLRLMTKGPVFLFAAVCVAIVMAFGYSNRQNATPGSGMSVDVLAAAFTGALGALTVTTSVAVSHLFSLNQASEAKDQAGDARV